MVIITIYYGFEAGEGDKRVLEGGRDREKVLRSMNQGSWWGGKMVEVGALEEVSYKIAKWQEESKVHGSEIKWCLVIFSYKV